MNAFQIEAKVLQLTDVQPEAIYEYLVLLDSTQLPVTVDDTLAIDFVRILHSAGMINAEIPARTEGGTSYSTPARVFRLTQWGHEVLLSSGASTTLRASGSAPTMTAEGPMRAPPAQSA